MADAISIAVTHTCAFCGNVGLSDGDDGFFFCGLCGAQAEDIVDAGLGDEDFVADRGHGRDPALYSARHTRRASSPIKAEPLSQVPQSLSLYQSLSQAMKTPVDLRDHLGSTEPSDFGSSNALSPEDYYDNVRMSYVYGLQLMINYQCEALVEKFNVSPMICGISGSIWLRYIKSTRVFDDGWADEVQIQSQSESQGLNKMYTTKTGGKHEPRNSYNQRMVLLWYRTLRRRIPLSSTLAITYLSCHIAREAVLPTDIQRWTLEGKLPYLAAFVEIEKTIRSSRECPLSASFMFRPSQVVPLQKLESLAAVIAQSVGLTLPPVNFNMIASRYLKQLSLPVEKILPFARCIHDWSMPPGLWLSTCERRLPTRVCVMAILISTVRILYNLNGFGIWEASLSHASTCVDESNGSLKSPSKSPIDANTEASISPQDSDEEANYSEVHKLQHEAPSLLHDLQKRFGDISENFDYSKDMATYLQYCKNVVFGGLAPSFEEEKMINKLWDFYINRQKDSEDEEEPRTDWSDDGGNVPRKRIRYEEENVRSLDNIGAESPISIQERGNSASNAQSSEAAEEPSSSNNEAQSKDSKDIAVRLMKLHMEENRFYYIPPRTRIKRLDYLHYVRKRDDGALTYAAHADYYILLHACAREARVDIRVMHQGVMSLERRLAWIEKRIDHSLATLPQVDLKLT